MSDGGIEKLLDAVRDVDPPSLSEDRIDDIVDAALDGAEAPPQLPVRRAPWLLAAAVMLLAGGGAWLAMPEPEPVRTVASTTLHLPSGDRLVAASGALFEVERAEVQRRIRIDDGAVLFDVVPLAEAESFEVDVGGTQVHVRGTVFSVRREAESTLVRVYEGSVEVRHHGSVRVLGAGELWSSGEALPALPALDRVGREAARARAAVARRVPADEVEVEAPPEPVAEAPRAEPAERRPERERAAPSLQSTAPSPSASPARVVGLEEATAWIAEGRYADALAAAHDALTLYPSGAWRLVEADALRGMRRYREAARSYDRAASTLDEGPERARAGFTGAQIRFRRLSDLPGAIHSLDASGAAGPGSPLLERALALRVQALHQLGRDPEARVEAERYLRRYDDDGATAEWMRRLVHLRR